MRIVNKIVLAVLACMLMVLSAGIGQFVQLLHTQTDVRSVALQHWAHGDKQRLLAVNQFTKACLIGAPIERSESGLGAPISIEKCANSNGYEKLAEVILQADQTIKSYAWPLSLAAG